MSKAPAYDVHRKALELRDNPLLADLLEEMKTDCKNRLPTEAPDDLPALQLRYRLVEEIATMITNRIAQTREAG